MLPAVNVEFVEVSERASYGFSAGSFGDGCAEITSEATLDVLPLTDLPPPLANENCLPKNEPVLIPLMPLPPALPGPPPPPLLVSLAVLPRFLFANSYMSPNIPAKVLRKFFIVSSASSTTEL